MPVNALVNIVVLAVMLASGAAAAPPPVTSQLATLRAHDLATDSVLLSYYPESTFETFGKSADRPVHKRAGDDLKGDAIAFVESHLKLGPDSVAFKSGYVNDIAKHAYLKQVIKGIPVANAVANVVFDKDGKVSAFGYSFVKPTTIPSTTPSINLQEAITRAESVVNGTYNQHPATLEFVAKQDNSVALAHVLQIENEHTGAWVEAFVDAHSGDVVHMTDFVAKSSYRALHITKQYPTQGFDTILDPQDLLSSRLGWHNDGRATTTITAGNNAVAYGGPQSLTTSQSSPILNFIYPQNPNQQPTTQANLDAARTNAFYVANVVHDFSYKYGFTEEAFNFQNNNFGYGGYGNDRVSISVQDPSGRNNAFFATPPDGQSGRMSMFLWDHSNPWRDGSLENSILIHEYTHGITNRMTGGGTGACLQTYESGGLGEGWSDAMAEWATHRDSSVPDFYVGQYVTNSASGIRRYPYSTNPYSTLRFLNEVHDIGEVWANILHNVYAALVKQRGFFPDARFNPTVFFGNVIFLRNFIDALAIQPCNPTFIQARNAWIQADINRYDGANYCILWGAFASRGLGVDAGNYQDDFNVPSGC
ncbi:hypothetical protein NLI96_g4333 [Meripilus lineatus]|uniref:Extracellular metalloproteinase n=1 Tax=Meripilus lineatus TaxID=2056292 RepID=A0AAD5V7C4_9APHY|nr:hypothetical protein NLI96_g4333 [Physisporinus lineatus]